MAHRAISMPFLMVTTSLWQVAHSQLARYSDEERAILFSKIHRVSSLVYAFPLTFVVLFPEIVVIVFGSGWSAVSDIVPAIAVMVYFSSIANSTNYFVVFGLHGWDSAANIVLFAVRLGAIAAGAAFSDFHGTILLYCFCSAAVYLITNIVWAAYFRRVSEYLIYLLGAPLLATAVLMPLVYYVGLWTRR